MKLVDALSYGFKALQERRLRSALTIMGIAIGTALIIALVANGEGLNVSVTQNLLELGANNIIVVPSRGSSLSFTDADVRRVSIIAGVDRVFPFYSTPATIKAGGVTIDGRIMAIDPEGVTILFPKLRVMQGRPPSPSDISLVGIGYDVAFPPDYSGTYILPGHTLVVRTIIDGKVREKAFVVGAVYDKFGATLFIDADSMVLMSIPAGRNLLGINTYRGLVVRVSETEMVDFVIERLKDIYGRAATVISPTSMVQTIQQLINSFTLFLMTVAAISLLVAGIGIANTMIMSVMERVKEVGVLRAIGMKKGDVLLVFLSEALLTGVMGGLIGVTLGVALSLGMGSIFGSFLRGGPDLRTTIPYEPIITHSLLISTFLFAVLVGTLAGIYPARKAASLDPVKALRTE